MPQPWQNIEEEKYMSRLTEVFKNKALTGFLTAGDPDIESNERYIMQMVNAGVDIVEIEIPFSDPIMEGEIIQASALRALKSGTTTDKVFDLVNSIRKKSDIPIVFLTYLNPVFNYGYEKFFQQCKKLMVDGVIIPDLPYEEKTEVELIANKYDTDIISLIVNAPKERVQKIAKSAKGFIYIVPSADSTEENTQDLICTIKEVTNVPCAVGFGISTLEQAKKYAVISDGIILGSAIVRIIAQYGKNADTKIYDYIKSIKEIIQS